MNSILSKRNELTTKFSNIDVNNIQDAGLRSKAKALKARQGGFTLLELLVVVAILASIAGTATLALQDTDARAAAAAHVAMMDELNKGVRTYKALNKAFPDSFDSLMQTTDATINPLTNLGTAATNVGLLAGGLLAIEDVALKPISAGVVSAMDEVGLKTVRVVIAHADQAPDDSSNNTCADVKSLIEARTNAVVAGNIFMSPEVNGCGDAHTLQRKDQLAFWKGGSERITGRAESGSWSDDGNTAYVSFGVGPASTLFDTTKLGGMTSVPVYRHVSKEQYNRFIAIFAVGKFNSTNKECVAPTVAAAGTAPDVTDTVALQAARQATINAAYLKIGTEAKCLGTGDPSNNVVIDAAFDHDGDATAASASGEINVTTATHAGTWESTGFQRSEQVQLVTIVDGAGDTKEEELGEWDGTRNTI